MLEKKKSRSLCKMCHPHRSSCQRVPVPERASATSPDASRSIANALALLSHFKISFHYIFTTESAHTTHQQAQAKCKITECISLDNGRWYCDGSLHSFLSPVGLGGGGSDDSALLCKTVDPQMVSGRRALLVQGMASREYRIKARCM